MTWTKLDQLMRRLSFDASGIDAVAIGGSCGRQSSDEHSDADIFLLASDEITDIVTASVDRIVCTTISVAARSHNAPYSGFGLRESYIDESGRIYEIFINSRASFDRDPIRAGMRIIHDRSGWLSEFCKTLERSPDYSIRYDRLIFDYLNSLSKCLKYLSRGHLIQASGRLINLSQTAIALDALIRTRSQGHVHGLDRKNSCELEAMGYATDQLLPSKGSASTIATYALRRSVFVIELLRTCPDHSGKYESAIDAAEHINASLSKLAFALEG